MIKLFLKHFQSKYTDSKKRYEKGTVISGWVAIVSNVLLFLIKIIIGAVSGAMSIISDAFHNLSDASSGVITLIGEKISRKPVDEEHPFGHGRMEYVSAMITSFIIIVVGLELVKSSFQEILSPSEVKYSTLTLVLLAITIVFKIYFSYFFMKMYKVTNNINLKLVSTESIFDCLITFGAIIAFLISSLTSFHLADGIIGMIIAIIILVEGIKLLAEIVSKLLGKAPDKEMMRRIKEIITNTEGITGVHELIIHYYGSNKYFASAHAETPADSDLLYVHNEIDKAERQIMEELNVMICIHTDPIENNNDIVMQAQELTKKIINSYDSDFSIHDFRLSEKNGTKKYIFDLVIPFQYKKDKNTIANELKEIFHNEDENIKLSMNIEHSYD